MSGRSSISGSNSNSSSSSSSSKSTHNSGGSGAEKKKEEKEEEEEEREEEEVLFGEGSRVEVCSNEAGLRGVWFVGTIVNPKEEEEQTNYIKKKKNNNNKNNNKEWVVVKYDNLLADEESREPLKEEINLSFVRPAPPNPIPLHIISSSSSSYNTTTTSRSGDGGGAISTSVVFGKDDLVDAFHRDGWWVGVVSEVIDDSNYLLFFHDPPELLSFNRSSLRLHLDWVQGKWILPQPQLHSQLLDMKKQKAGALETEKVKQIRLKMHAKKSQVRRSGGALSAGGKKSNAMLEGSDTEMLVKDTMDSQDKANYGPKGVEGSQKRKRGRPPAKRPIVFAERAVASVVIDSRDASVREASETNSKTKDAQIDCEMLNNEFGDLTPLPGQEGISPQIMMNDLGVSAGSGTINQSADVQKNAAAAALSTPTNANIANSNEVGGLIDDFVDKNNSQRWPFVKRSPLWPTIESTPIFRKTARTLHFSSLDKHDEEFREGLAIGYTVTFATMLERIPKMQISGPTSIIERYLGTLAELEKLGFDVEQVQVCLKELLSKKARESQLQDESKELDRKIAECDLENKQLEDKQSEIAEKLRELQKEQEANALKKELKDKEIATLKSKKELINDNISTVNLDFQRRAASPL